MTKIVKWKKTLSTTEPFNNIGLVKVRQDNTSETWKIRVTENNRPYDFSSRNIKEVYFNTKFSRDRVVEQRGEIIDAKKGIIQYRMNNHDMQQVNPFQAAYFEFRTEDGSYVDSTQTFFYHIIPSKYQTCTDGGSYIIRLEELFKLYMDYHTKQTEDWERFVESNREILESIDPGGKILTELTDGRYSKMLDKHFPSLQARGDFWDEQLSTITKYPILDYEKEIVVDSSYDYHDLKRYGLRPDVLKNNSSDLEIAEHNYKVFKNVMTISDKVKYFYLKGKDKYVIKGEKELRFTKEIHLEGIDKPELFFLLDDGCGFNFTATSSSLINFVISNVSKITTGTGVKAVGSYNGLTQREIILKNNKVVKFGNNFYIADFWNLILHNNLSIQAYSTGYTLSNVTTMLDSRNNYALDCKNGHVISRCHYGTISAIAADGCELPYLFVGNKGITIDSLGLERNKMPVQIESSIITINSLVSELNISREGYPTTLLISKGSKVSLSSLVETKKDENTLCITSISVDGTSKLKIENSDMFLPIYCSQGSIVDGEYYVDGKINYLKSSKVVYIARNPYLHIDKVFKIGDRMENYLIDKSNPCVFWECISPGTPGEWRGVYIYLSGTLANRPVLEDYNYFGFKYMVVETGKDPYEITWIGSRWVRHDGTVINK